VGTTICFNLVIPSVIKRPAETILQKKIDEFCLLEERKNLRDFLFTDLKFEIILAQPHAESVKFKPSFMESDIPFGFIRMTSGTICNSL
jgi:hypothetical protein